MSYLESLFSLEGKVSIVTGAARGNGKAIAEALLRAGSAVVLVDIIREELTRTTDGFKAANLRAAMYTCDVADNSQLDALVEFVLAELGRVDVLVNNAGVTHPAPTLEYPEDAWEDTYRVVLKAPFELSKRVGKVMKERGAGVIINITSLSSELAFPNNPAYVTFKGALKHLSRSLALDLGQYGIRVNNIGPGYFITEMTRQTWEDPVLREDREARTVLRRWGEPQDLAGTVIFVASDASSYITGQDIYVDGGWLIKGL